MLKFKLGSEAWVINKRNHIVKKQTGQKAIIYNRCHSLMANKYCKHKVGSHLRWLFPIVFHWQSSRCDLSRTKRVGRNAVFLSDQYLWTILRFPNALRILARKWKPILPTYVLQHFRTFRTTFFSPVNIKLTHSRIQWMILAVCEAGASDTYEGKAYRNDRSNHAYHEISQPWPKFFSTVETGKSKSVETICLLKQINILMIFAKFAALKI